MDGRYFIGPFRPRPGGPTKNINHSFTLNQCVIEKLKRDIKNNKSAAAYYMRSCFHEVLDDEDFINRLSLAVALKPNCLKKLLLENLPNAILYSCLHRRIRIHMTFGQKSP